MNFLIRTSILLVIFFTSFCVHSQEKKGINNLLLQLQRANMKTRVQIYRDLCWEYRDLDPSEGVKFGKYGVDLATKLNLQYEVADLNNCIGINYRNKGEYSKAIALYFKSLKIASENNFGKILPYCYNNIGDIYNRLDIYSKALDYNYKALELFNKIDDKTGISYAYTQLGAIYKNKNKLDEAIIQYKLALKLRIELNFESGIAACYQNIGYIYLKKGDYESSIDYYNKGLELFMKLKVASGIVNCLNGIGEYHSIKKNYSKATQIFDEALIRAQKIGSLQYASNAAYGLQIIYEHKNQFEKAYKYQSYVKKLNDSLTNNSFIKRITQLEMDFNFDLQKRQLQENQKVKELASAEKIKYQSKVTYAFVFAFIISFLAFILIWINLKNKNLLNKNLETKNQLIENININLSIANQEISDQKSLLLQQAKEIERSRDELQIENISKDKFISIIAHDLRNPLHGMIGLSEILITEKCDYSVDNVIFIAKAINDASKSAFSLLENLLEWAKIQRGRIIFLPEFISINNIIDNVFQLVNIMAENRNISLKNNLKTKYIVFADSNMVNTIVRNLITNALKFTLEKGTVTVDAEIDARDPNFLLIKVTDTGIGISEKDLEKLFRIDVNNVDIGKAKVDKGTGLGLILCKEFVDKNNGKIWAESELEVGTTFMFTLPINNV